MEIVYWLKIYLFNMNWHLENARNREKEKEADLDPFSKYKPKKKEKVPTSPESEQRDLLAKLLNRPFRQVAGLTKGWTVDEMYKIRKRAESFIKNPQALAWKLLKQHNEEIKKQLKEAERRLTGN